MLEVVGRHQVAAQSGQHTGRRPGGSGDLPDLPVGLGQQVELARAVTAEAQVHPGVAGQVPHGDRAAARVHQHVLSPVGWSATSTFTGNEDLVKRYKEMFSGDPNEDAANGYTVGQVIEAAVNAVKCADPSKACQDKLTEHIRQGTFQTVVGPLSFDDQGRPEQAHMIQQYVDGKIEIVLPEQARTAGLVYPKRAW
ncbi:ABC transporter substrate-binding protein [Nonomuraea sp. B12E4]|uniref:ABC transporter substrate-binding protein n=1 Tax=Nonomuraea sp. B12E4 TaxID=3153564 RepID=UPI00325DEE89